jgi:hypothetical protein
VSTRYALRTLDLLDQQGKGALLTVVDALETAEAASVHMLQENAAFLYGSPGEAVAVLLGAPWKLLAEREVSLPNEHHDSAVLQYNTVVLAHEELMVAFRIKCYDSPERPSRERGYDWRGLTALQRFNALLSAAGNFVVGVGYDGLFAALADTVENSRYGTDPTNWLDAARILIDQSRSAEGEPTVLAAMNDALFLSQLGSPRFTSLLAS